MYGHSSLHSGWLRVRLLRVAMANCAPPAKCTQLKWRTSERCVVAAHNAILQAWSQSGSVGSQRTSHWILAEQHPRADLYQPRVVLVVVEHAKVPLPRSVYSWAPCIAGIGTTHCQRAEVRTAEILGRQFGIMEA